MASSFAPSLCQPRQSLAPQAEDRLRHGVGYDAVDLIFVPAERVQTLAEAIREGGWVTELRAASVFMAGEIRSDRRRGATWVKHLDALLAFSHQQSSGGTEKEMSVRVGIVGVGVMGADHARILASQVSGATVQALYDADLARAKAIADEIGAPAVATDAAALVRDAGVDAVLVGFARSYSQGSGAGLHRGAQAGALRKAVGADGGGMP